MLLAPSQHPTSAAVGKGWDVGGPSVGSHSAKNPVHGCQCGKERDGAGVSPASSPHGITCIFPWKVYFDSLRLCDATLLGSVSRLSRSVEAVRDGETFGPVMAWRFYVAADVSQSKCFN